MSEDWSGSNMLGIMQTWWVCDKPDSKVSIHQRSLGVLGSIVFTSWEPGFFNIERLHL